MPISANVKPEESGGACQMTIVTLVSGCGNAYPGDGTRDGGGQGGRWVGGSECHATYLGERHNPRAGGALHAEIVAAAKGITGGIDAIRYHAVTLRSRGALRM